MGSSLGWPRIAVFAALAALVGCASGRAAGGGAEGDGWDADWLWAGAHVTGDAAFGWGTVRVDGAREGAPSAVELARSGAAAWMMRAFERDAGAGPRFDDATIGRLTRDLEGTASVVGTWTSSTGRSFAAARLTIDEALPTFARAPSWSKVDEARLRSTMAELARRYPPATRTPPAWVTAPVKIGPPPARVLAGVGTAQGIRNVALARSTAGARARAEIARTLDVLLARLYRDYTQRFGTGEISAGDVGDEGSEAPVIDARRAWTHAALSKVEVTAHWWDVRRDVHYARAELALASFFDLVRAEAATPEIGARIVKSLEAVIEDWAEP